MTTATRLPLSEVAVEFTDIEFDPSEQPTAGGQKQVFFGESGGRLVVLKLVEDDDLAAGDGDVDNDEADSPPFAHSVERARREVEKLRQIESVHVEKIVAGPDFRSFGGRRYLWFVAERYGESLASRIARGALPLEQVRNLIHGLLEADLAVLGAGIGAHRDIKPDNILFHPSTDRPVLIDLGVALHIDLPRITVDTFAGTFLYAAPEQLENSRPVDERSDLYLIGLSAYEALTQKRPFADATSFPDLLAKMRAGVTISPLLAGGADESTARFIAKCLQYYAHERFPTSQQALDDFRADSGGSK